MYAQPKIPFELEPRRCHAVALRGRTVDEATAWLEGYWQRQADKFGVRFADLQFELDASDALWSRTSVVEILPGERQTRVR